MRVYLRDGSPQTVLRAATLRWKLQIKLSISPSHSILTPGQPVQALTLYRRAPGRVATGVPIFTSLVWLDPRIIPAQAGFEPGTFRSRGGRLNHYAKEEADSGEERFLWSGGLLLGANKTLELTSSIALLHKQLFASIPRWQFVGVASDCCPQGRCLCKRKLGEKRKPRNVCFQGDCIVDLSKITTWLSRLLAGRHSTKRERPTTEQKKARRWRQKRPVTAVEHWP